MALHEKIESNFGIGNKEDLNGKFVSFCGNMRGNICMVGRF